MGEGDPVDDDPPVIHLTEQEELDLKLQEEKWLEAMIEEGKKEARERRRQKAEELREAMKKLINLIPERELCEYEKLRMSNIEERENAMAECGFFDDLASFKSEIGLVEESVISDKKSDSSDESGKEVKKIKKGKKLCDIKENKLTRKQFHHEKARSDGVTNHEPSEEKEKTDSPAAKKHQESKKPLYENFHIDEWHLHDCFE